ncbi:ImmA/IrrE family metallo-endopeptidase [Halomonas sp. GD1P12]|uniref:ImmA/IrrE family metallo-endopeptidase n=1 Tax=Halomonas sp. GD1P12 TaxID=2982691 RepID=UPI0021E4B38F|nr:ImmA/IrrE family metallo-endopeptidase [Halomonas sp. GD1P12]UYF99347.1 ImmA/IrrE family metallo-endopeptidase [Halomonas sp. GD1P12]
MARVNVTEKVRKVLELTWDDELPVEPVDIARYLLITKGGEKRNISMVGRSNIQFSGQARFDKDKGRYFCEYNTTEPSYRQRFTQAHELGHVVLGHVRNGASPKRDTSFAVSSNDQDEIDANQFAAELLMPEEYVRTAVKQEFNLNKLANLFDVSTTAMHYRLKNLRLL